jgi:primosomal protein N'
MIAEVYPIKKMPRKAKVFDYKIPDNLKLNRGDMVKIPFRNQELFGIVAKVKDKPPRGIKLKDVASSYKEIRIREDELSFFEQISLELAQSVPSLLHLAIPTPYKRESTSVENTIFGAALTIPSSEAVSISRTVKYLLDRNQAFVFSPDIKRTAAAIASYIREKEDQKCVVLAPNVADAKLLAKYLHGFNPHLVTGDETQGKRFHSFTSFKSDPGALLIGTKPALFFFDSEVTSIFVIKSSHKNHGQHERNPRYDLRHIAKLYSQKFSTNLFFFDVAPRIDDLNYFSKINTLGSPTNTEVEIVRMELEKKHAPHPALSLHTLNTIEDVLGSGAPVLCVFNKKGKALRLKCNDCQKAIQCSVCSNIVSVHKHAMHCIRCSNKEPIPRHCSGCKGTNLFEVGFGIEAIEDALQKLFPNFKINKIDKEHPEFNPSAHIYLSTSYFLENHFNPFKPKKFGVVILLDADSALYRQSFRGLEEALVETDSYRSIAHASRARFILQTNSPALFQEFFDDPCKMFAKELETRNAYSQAPFVRWATVSFEEKESRKAEVEINILSQNIKKIVEDVKIRMQEKDTGKYVIEFGAKTNEFSKLLPLFKSLPDRYIIDTNAFY